MTYNFTGKYIKLSYYDNDGFLYIYPHLLLWQRRFRVTLTSNTDLQIV